MVSLRAGESPQARQFRTVKLLRSLSSEDAAGQVKGNGKSTTRKDKVAPRTNCFYFIAEMDQRFRLTPDFSRTTQCVPA